MARRLAPLAVLAATALVAACGKATSSYEARTLPRPGSSAPSATSHVVVLVMENKEYSEVVGSPQTPYFASLARRYALASRFYAITHPSLPNYLALTAGSTLGVHSDCTSCHVRARNLVDQLEEAHVSWKAYMDGLPRSCFTGATSGAYAKKHDPFLYYDDVRQDPARCARVVPGSQLASDLRAGRLPTFAWVTPDSCENTHDCSIATGDRYLKQVVPAILRGLGPHGYLVVTWDEGTTGAGCCSPRAQGGHIATLLAGPDVRPSARLTAPYSHYAILRTVEDSLRLGRLGAAGSSQTRSLTAGFTRAPSLRKQR